jgi:hypothetical protein
MVATESDEMQLPGLLIALQAPGHEARLGWFAHLRCDG